MTIDQIDVSPLNVRRHRADITALAAMEASILGRGLIQPLNVHPMLGGKRFGAFAGGRRCRAIRNLVKRGDLPTDWPVRVEVYREHSDVEIIELSLGENIQRRDLQDYEVCAAVKALDDRKQTPDQIATALGQPLSTVRKWLRVGQLAPVLFEAFAAGTLSGDDARAYASTSDQKLQLAAFEQLAPLPSWQRVPEKIRAAMKVGDRQEARLLRLVGDEAYRAAGGRFDLDLFADEADQRGRVVDGGLLREMAEARFVEVREATRIAVGRRELRFISSPPQAQHGGADYQLQVTPKKTDGKLKLPDGDVVALIEISDAGEPQVSYWWENRKAKFGDKGERRERPQVKAADALRDPYSYAGPAKAAVKEEHGVSADALEAVRSIRRELLRALVVQDVRHGGFAGLDFQVWGQLRVLLSGASEGNVGLRAPARSDNVVGIGFGVMDKAKAQVEQHHAHEVWCEAVQEISAQAFIVEKDLSAAFREYRAADTATKHLAGAVLAGLVMERSANAPGFQCAAHEPLAQVTGGAGAAIRTYWSPTAEFLELLPKGQLLAIAEPIVGPDTFARWSKVKAAELPALLAQALNGGGNAIAARHRKAADDWVHPLLAFPPAKRSTPVDAPELAEAAE